MTSIVPPGALVYGMQLPVQSQSTIYVEPWETEAGADAMRQIVRKADQTGFSYLAVCDHIAIPRPLDKRMSTTWYDTVATLGWVAALTENVRLLSHVYVPAYRHPLVGAKAFMTLDELSGGRVILGVGAGHVESEFALLGVDFHRRGRLLDEAIDVMRAAFADEYVSDAGMRPRPRQAALPIWVGGSSPAAIRRAAERGDGWLPQGTPWSEMPAAVARLREHRAATLGDDPIDIGTIAPTLYVGDPPWETAPHDLTGPPEKLAERLRRVTTMGVNHVQVRFRSRSLAELLDQMDVFAADVAPLVPFSTQ